MLRHSDIMELLDDGIEENQIHLCPNDSKRQGNGDLLDLVKMFDLETSVKISSENNI